MFWKKKKGEGSKLLSESEAGLIASQTMKISPLPDRCVQAALQELAITAKRLAEGPGEGRTELARELSDRASQHFHGLAHKTFPASGWLFRDRDGRVGMITNRHNIGCSNLLRFGSEGSSTHSTMRRTTTGVDYVDGDANIAIVWIPDLENKDHMPPGLPMSSSTPEQDALIYLAGFPESDDGGHAYALTMGRVQDPDFQLAHERSGESNAPRALLCHSAASPPGANGGPLLSRDASGELRVVGMNTYKISRDQVGGVGIKSVAIRKVIDAAASRRENRVREREGEASLPPECLTQALERFSAEILEMDPESARLLGMVSNEMATHMDYGLGRYLAHLNFVVGATSPLREEQLQAWFRQWTKDPIEKMRYLAVEHMTDGIESFEVSGPEAVFVQRVFTEDFEQCPLGPVRVLFGTDSDMKFYTRWMLDQGDWKLHSMDAGLEPGLSK